MTVNERYRSMDGNMVFSVVDWQRNQSRTCGDVQNDVLPFVTEYYTAQHWKQSADDVFVLLATEWNILVMTAGGTDAALENKRRFPTLLRLAPFQQQDLTDVVMSLLQQYNWTNLALICDDSATEFNTFFLICRALPDVIKKRHSVVLTHLHYDLKANPDYERYLTEAATYSRVLLISTHGSRLRNILVVASKMGMANGEYAFIDILPFASPFIGKLTWKNNDDDDALAKAAYRYLLLVSCMPARIGQTDDLSIRIKNRSSSLYGLQYNGDEEINVYGRGYYVGIQILAQVLAGLQAATVSGVELSKLIWNHSFDTDFGYYNINSNGDFDSAMGVRGLVEGGDNMEIIYQYEKKSGHLVAINGTRWLLNGSAPLNRPACGFRGENPKCHQRGLTPESSITTIAASTTAVALIAAFTVFHKQLHSRHTKTGTLAYRNVYVYGSQLVWCRSGQLSHGTYGTTHLSGKLIKRINMRSALKHNNIVDLVGVALEKDKIMIFSQYRPKGSLYEIIEEKPSWLSWDLKTAMLADIINGLAFIHSSDLKFHDALKSPNCMVTNQLVIKLTDFGWPKEMTVIGQPDDLDTLA
ncbi:atrial natriuretic peptide receptor 1-like [Paramacrobiotus metropolitanus]|uniref:atrial natriuretic peptide receptor 1-like n=1 Tax=Paramacrobiotus metropolitanus TaxID=2943436 RepID=UPI0024459523|nr:atrial natriuretic peptide receptor 1-like [Paramacrobiotus metropolitanus]